MIMDKELLLSDKQAVTATAVSTNTIDLTNARDIGIGNCLALTIRVTTAFAGGTSIQFAYITSGNPDLSAPSVIVQTPAIPAADLVLGSEWLRVEVPTLSKASEMKRYVGVQYTVVGTFTAGTVTAGIVLDREALVNYPQRLNMGGF